MYRIGEQTNRTTHIHTATKGVATQLLAAIIGGHENLVYDRERSMRAGYTVFSVRFDETDPDTETGTVSDLGTRFEINDHANCFTTCVWYDEE